MLVTCRSKSQKGEGKVCTWAKWLIRPTLIFGFCGMKRLNVFLFTPGWDATSAQGYISALDSPVLKYTPGWREVLPHLSVWPKNTTQCSRPGLESGRSIRKPPRLHYQTECQWNFFGAGYKLLTSTFERQHGPFSKKAHLSSHSFLVVTFITFKCDFVPRAVLFTWIWNVRVSWNCRLWTVLYWNQIKRTTSNECTDPESADAVVLTIKY